MDIVADVLQFIAQNVFNEVAILIGLITLVGLLLQRAPIEDIIAGAPPRCSGRQGITGQSRAVRGGPT